MQGFGILLGIVAIAVTYLVIIGVAAAVAARSKQAVVCPGDGKSAMVRRSALGGAREVFGGTQARIGACDRWPARADCPQNCVGQLTAPPTLEQVERVLHHRVDRP